MDRRSGRVRQTASSGRRARRLGPLGELIEAAGSSVPGRLAVALGWAWLGWHLLAR